MWQLGSSVGCRGGEGEEKGREGWVGPGRWLGFVTVTSGFSKTESNG